MTSTPEHRDRSGDPPPEDDERYEFVDVRDLDPDDDEPARRRPRRAAAAKRKPATKRTTPRRRGRKGAEIAVGALVCMTLSGILTYWLLREGLGYPRDLCLVVGGMAAGLATWLGPVIIAARLRLAAWIAPGKTSGARS